MDAISPPAGALEPAVRAALPLWSLSPACRISLLNVSENTTFRLDDPKTGRRLVLRVHRPGYHAEAEIASELAWIRALEQAGIATAAPVPTAAGNPLGRVHPPDGPRHAVAFEHLPGRPPQPDEALGGWFCRLGGLAARLHRHARAWRPPPGFTRKTWDFETMLGRRAVWGDWRAGRGLDRAGRALLERAAACLHRRLARLGTSPGRFGLIHADLRLANLLIDGPALRVIDFDDCGFGWFAYDFAASVSFIEHDPAVPALLADWLEGYREVAPFGPEDAAEIPAFVMLRRLLLTAWIASHAEAAEARELGPGYAAGTLALAEEFLCRYGAGRA